MGLLHIIIFLIVVGVILQFLPVEARIKQLIYVVILIFILLWLLQVAGILGSLRLR